MDKIIQIRQVNINDIQKIFELSNDKMVRQNSINTKKIEWESHVKWFNERLKKTNDLFYIIEDNNNNFIGQVRIENNGENIISISITPNFRGKGLATTIIKECSKKSNKSPIFAFIKTTNKVSLNAFLNAGYKIHIKNFVINETFYTKLKYSNESL